MIRLEEKDLRTAAHQSSKGNQLKWESEGVWYKADYTGYEGLAEYVVSKLLRYSNMEENDYILYETEEIRYKQAIYRAVAAEIFSRMAGSLSRWRDCSRICMGGVCM